MTTSRAQRYSEALWIRRRAAALDVEAIAVRVAELHDDLGLPRDGAAQMIRRLKAQIAEKRQASADWHESLQQLHRYHGVPL